MAVTESRFVSFVLWTWTLRPGVLALSTTHSRVHQANKALICTTVNSQSSSAASREVNVVTKAEEHTSTRAGWERKEEPQCNNHFPGHEKGIDKPRTGTPFLVFVTACGQGWTR